MDKTLISLLGGASALALVGGSQASAAPGVDETNMLQPARSFAELLDPIPNAENVLRAENERGAAVAEENPLVVAQYYHHHHHHHHHITTTITITTITIIIIIITITTTIITTTEVAAINARPKWRAPAFRMVLANDGSSQRRRAFSVAAPRICRYVPSKTVFVAEVHSVSADSVERL